MASELIGRATSGDVSRHGDRQKRGRLAWREGLLFGPFLALGAACSQAPDRIIRETVPDVAAVAGSVTAASGRVVVGAMLHIAAFRGTGASAQSLGTFSAQTDSAGGYSQTLLLQSVGLQECLLRVTVTPPAGSGLSGEADSVMAQVRAASPGETAIVNFVLTP